MLRSSGLVCLWKFGEVKMTKQKKMATRMTQATGMTAPGSPLMRFSTWLLCFTKMFW